ncbi:alpha-N-acetylglucosaminidase [Epithele typhae]|uniref:alpha-N-acetylglucosaminidase n=1 Tax=Epithele typhae TaxID=378194 RepID=UPI002007D4A4|nr:alpha-N-acetylglucosaminidase [Epithele typhae]KAH9919962.1 alpha-N-acetylglucosaminidase [Epithele typhae]
MVGLRGVVAASLVGLLLSAVGASAEPSVDGLYALAKRRLPLHAHAFTFHLTDGEGDTFVVSDASHGGVKVECTSVSGCARGLYTYLTQVGGTDIWWTGSRLDNLPLVLPKVGKPIKGQSIVPYRYHFNTVTFSYTTAFWDFEQWELELDWLALRGVNIPLAWVGYEYILAETFRDVGLTDANIATFLSGPAFQAWNRFGNLQGSWGGDLPTQWIEDQFALQKKLVARMVELGMTPVLPSFTGFVPRALADLYPNASIIIGDQWSGFPSSLTNDSFLEPFDDLFASMQKTFISKQRDAYGDISHIYTLDQYNEINPFSGDLEYLRNVTANTFASLQAADPEAVWLMQGWLFFSSSSFWTTDRIEAYLSGVPGKESMIILDLYSEAQPQWERTSSYFGKQWVWCELHDYGGNMGLEGNLSALTTGPIAALASNGSSMAGIGLTMEGQEGNELVYDILLDQAWSAAPLDPAAYVDAWVARRYGPGAVPAAARDAWRTLAATVYNNADPSSQATVKSIFELAPALTGLTGRGGHHPTAIPYDTNATIVPALAGLLAARAAHPRLAAVPEFQRDVVDVARQLLANRFVDHYNVLVGAFGSSGADAGAVRAAGATLLDLLADLDALLYTDENFLLSTWIADARAWAGRDAAYAAYLEYNARNQITLWGPDGEIDDYASKAWAGLVGTYYAVRWEAFVGYLAEVKEAGAAYDAAAVLAKNIELGRAWGVRGSSWAMAEKVMRKWA